MADVQKENGYTPIANELLDAIYNNPFNATQLKIILIICRYTYGFSRKEHSLSESFISKAANISKRYISQELNKLIESNVVTIVKPHSDISSRVLTLNKNYDKWIMTSRTIIPQVNNTSTDEQLNDTTVEQLFHPTDEQLFHQDKQIIKQNLKQNIYSDFCSEILNHWNSKNIIVHKESEDILKTISSSLKKYSKDEITIYIDRYDNVLKDEGYYFNYKWTLKEFLTRKSGISDFTDQGSKWLNYCSRLNKIKTKEGEKIGINGRSTEDELRELGIGIY